MRKFPNALVIMIGFILFSSILTHIIPHGEYERVTDNETNHETVVPGSYRVVKGEPFSIFQTFMAIPEGIILGAKLMVLILLLGGCFYVIEQTGALKEGMIIDTIIYGLFTPLQYLPKSLSAVSMMFSQALLHFPVPVILARPF